MLSLEWQLRALEVEIARRENGKSLGVAAQDYFILWRPKSVCSLVSRAPVAGSKPSRFLPLGPLDIAYEPTFV
jgi:hypothetical protein